MSALDRIRLIPVLLVLLCLWTLTVNGQDQLQIILNSQQATFLDIDEEPLAIGESQINQDGDLLQLGYFTQATTTDLFAGEWVPLASQIYFGDSSTLSGGVPGKFQVALLFVNNSDTVTVYPDASGTFETSAPYIITHSAPGANKLLAIRYYDQNLISDGIRYNTIANPNWLWGNLTGQLAFPLIIEVDVESTDLAFQDPDSPYVASVKKNTSLENQPIHSLTGTIQGNGSVKGFGKYEQGTTAQLEAIPEEGYEFHSWNGAISGSTNHSSITITEDKQVNAEFSILTYSLSPAITPANGGTVNGSGDYDYNQEAELTAVPATGHRFLYWVIDGEQSFETSFTLTANKEYDLEVAFEPIFYSLTINQSPANGGQVAGSGVYAYGTVKTIEATPAEGYQFAGWSGATVQDPSSASTEITIQGDATLTANFELIPDPTHTIILTAVPEVGGTLSGAGTFDHDSEVQISATPSHDYYFQRWVDEDGNSLYSNPLTLTLSSDITRTGIFLKRPFNILLSGDIEKEVILPSGSGSFDNKEEVNIEAFPLETWDLANWTSNGELNFQVRALPSADNSQTVLYIDELERRQLRLVRGGTYHFNLSELELANHPFYFSTSEQADVSGNFAEEYTDGITNSRSTSGIVSFTVSKDAPDILYYHSGSITQAGGVIHIYNVEEVLTSLTDNPTTLQILADISIVANYDREHYDISATAFPTYGGSVSGAGVYQWGEEVTFTATPGENYTFTSWNGLPEEDTSTNPITLTINGGLNLNANFTYTGPATHTLTVVANPTEGGTTTGSGEIAHASATTISAQPASGYRFLNWSGDAAVSTDAVTTNTTIILGETTITANFEKIPEYTLTLDASPQGAGSLFGGGTYQEDTSVTVIAFPASGYEFVNWTGSDQLLNPNSTTTTLPLAANTTLTANFNFVGTDTYDLSINVSPANAGTTTGSGTYPSGRLVPIEATPNPGYEFESWTGGEVTAPTEAETTYQLFNDKTLTANFQYVGLPDHTLTLQANPSGAGTLIGAGEYEEGTEVSIQATSATGYQFLGWTGGTPADPSKSSTTITLESDTTLIANFQYLGTGNTLTINTNPPDAGTTTGAGNYETGATVNIQATPAEDYKFTGWTGGNVASANATQTTLTLSSDITLTANFEPLSEYTVTIAANPTSAGSVSESGTYVEGTSITIEATPLEGYTFHSWSGAEVVNPTASTTTLVVSKESTVYANFTYSGPSTHTLTLTSSPEAIGTLQGAGTYGHGASALIQAIPPIGYHFLHWSDDDSLIITENPTRITLNTDVSLTANFHKIQITSPLAHETGNWLNSPWFGMFLRTDSDWIYSANLGWLYPVGDSDESVWLATPQGKWYWTSEQVYPWFYQDDQGIWYYYSNDHSTFQKAYIYNSEDQVWESYSPPQLP